jgi:3-methyladenine DNA glycosylase/8-oxoguanine DNA glycosylase
VARIPAKVEEGARVLARRDKVMRTMVREHGLPDRLGRRTRTPHFAELTRMITYQQLAGRAAAAIYGRFLALFDGPPTPEAVLALPVETLRGVGLSRAKATSIVDLAEKVEHGDVELDRVSRLPDDEVVRELTLVRGIGEWTAHMFLMFQVGRLDVWPTLDYGVRAGYARLYGLDPPPTAKALVALGERFEPYRSIAAWYCWRAVDTVTPSG